MRWRDIFDWVAVVGAVLMVVAASFVDWRAGLFVVGFVLWWDFR